jgi:hypothetical protein
VRRVDLEHDRSGAGGDQRHDVGERQRAAARRQVKVEAKRVDAEAGVKTGSSGCDGRLSSRRGGCGSSARSANIAAEA